jgi:hypothetical protein
MHVLKKRLELLAIGLLGVVLVAWRVLSVLSYHVDPVLPEPIHVGNLEVVSVGRALPAVTEFSVLPVREAASELNPNELVLGVEVKGEARAYPINMLSGPNHEILNDTLGGRPIAATW